jgi:glutaredoxin
LLSRPGCHLCDDAREVIATVCAATGESFDEVSVESDPELLRLYSEQVPVVFVDDRQHDFWRVDPDRLRRALGRTRPS